MKAIVLLALLSLYAVFANDAFEGVETDDFMDEGIESFEVDLTEQEGVEAGASKEPGFDTNRRITIFSRCKEDTPCSHALRSCLLRDKSTLQLCKGALFHSEPCKKRRLPCQLSFTDCVKSKCPVQVIPACPENTPCREAYTVCVKQPHMKVCHDKPDSRQCTIALRPCKQSFMQCGKNVCGLKKYGPGELPAEREVPSVTGEMPLPADKGITGALPPADKGITGALPVPVEKGITGALPVPAWKGITGALPAEKGITGPFLPREKAATGVWPAEKGLTGELPPKKGKEERIPAATGIPAPPAPHFHP